MSWATLLLFFRLIFAPPKVWQYMGGCEEASSRRIVVLKLGFLYTLDDSLSLFWKGLLSGVSSGEWQGSTLAKGSFFKRGAWGAGCFPRLFLAWTGVVLDEEDPSLFSGGGGGPSGAGSFGSCSVGIAMDPVLLISISGLPGDSVVLTSYISSFPSLSTTKTSKALFFVSKEALVF